MVKPASQKQPAQQVTPADTVDDAPTQSAKTPKELPAWKACFTMLCLPVGVLMFLTGLAGLVVLTDPENNTWLGQSWFGSNWHKLMDYNSMINAFFLNGGLLAAVIAYTRLREHRIAKELRLFQSKFKIYDPSEILQQRGRSNKYEPKKRK